MSDVAITEHVGKVTTPQPGRLSREVFPDLDIAKLLMAYMVVEIHTQPLAGILPSNVISAMQCFAVPFFFIASGFLCFRGLDVSAMHDKNCRAGRRVRGTVSKLLRLYLTWTVISIPMAVFQWTMTDWRPLFAIAVWVRGVLFIGSNSGSNQLWYLLAAVVAFVLIYFMLRGGGSWQLILVVASVFLLLGWVLDSINESQNVPEPLSFLVALYYKVFANTRNGLFEGFFYVALGLAFGVNWGSIQRVGIFPLIAAVLVGFAGCCLVTANASLPFCVILAAAFFLLSVRRHGIHLAAHPFVRNVSTGVYLSHLIFVVIFSFDICGAVSSDLLSTGCQGWQMFLFAVCCSTVLSVVACFAARRWVVVGRVFGFL